MKKFMLLGFMLLASSLFAEPIPFRGVVEGYYGRPWGTEGRLSLLDFMGENKMNTFIYGPKDDPYHHAKWREPYPAAEMADFKKLLASSKRNGVNFYWAIHLGGSFRNDRPEDYQAMFRKLGWMYDAGFRSFAVFFDDFGGAEAKVHAEICNRIKREFLDKKGDCSPLIMCPHIYWGWGHPYQKTIGELVDQGVHIMWTGARVCSDIRAEDVRKITEDLRRPPFIWWNWPVNDYCRRKLLLGRTYGLDAAKYAGFVSNPMENCEANKLALYGVAKWALDPEHFDSKACWEDSFAKIYPDPEIAAAMRVFAEHNSDQGENGHLYRREESVSVAELCENARRELQTNGKLEPATADALTKLFRSVGKASRTLLEKLPTDHGLGWELEGWLKVEKSQMGTGIEAIRLLAANDEAQIRKIAEELRKIRSREQQAIEDHIEKFRRSTFDNDKGNVKRPEVSTRQLRPLIELMLDKALRRAYAKLHPGKEFKTRGEFKAFSNAKQLPSPVVMLTGGKYAGIERVLEIREIAAGESFGIVVPVDWKTDYFHCKLGNPAAAAAGVIELSRDGKKWQRLNADVKGAEMQKRLNPAEGWRFARYRNASAGKVSVKLELFKFDVQDVPSAFDEMLDAIVK